jgi:hypothetical protein
MNKGILGVMALMAMMGSAIAASSVYGSTVFNFHVPSTVSGMLYFLDAGSNSTEGSHPPTTVGSTNYFNSSNGYSWWVQPCVSAITWNGANVLCQNGVTRPAIRAMNTGTITWATLQVNVTAALPTGVTMCINGSMNSGSGTVTSNCPLGSINKTSWWTIGTAITAGSDVNVTPYANFSGTPGGTWSVTGVFNITG